MSYKYKGFWASIHAVCESDKSRLARGDWRSRILGYKYTVRRNGKVCLRVGYEDEETLPPTYDDAIADFQHRVDTILESL
ncbi:hypothetical protein I8752_35035 [Nostocaceae cyanobacterium CENA369]|uniref:Uncharacterized protein n=1 Tax=Dendronalium phyllosphericum CENA369 TaxID=1725256 RepID=A0A8J7I8I5_9NOST|nr:hypothetical protein [Dendronalium phyllosphericum]MBH8578071.1 hypothetical protein [Dendronalium phyllosphericum CENA369]